MKIIATLTAGLLSTVFASAAHAQQWVDAGFEGDGRVAVDLAVGREMPGAPVSASLAVIPRSWPANGHRYAIWLARFDCTARTRTITARIEYSSRHDPVRTMEQAPRPETGPAISRQLRIVCDRASDTGGTFSSLDAFLSGRR